MCGLKLPKMMEIVVLIGTFNRIKLNRLRNGGSFFSKKPKLGSYRSSKPNFRLLYRRTLCRMLFTKEWALKQSNLLAPLPLIGALGNSTSNNHSSVGSSSGKCAFSNSFSNSRNSKKKKTLEIRPRTLLKGVFKSLVMFYLISVSLLSHDQSLKCELSLKFPSHVNMGVLKLASLEMSLMKIFCLELLSFTDRDQI